MNDLANFPDSFTKDTVVLLKAASITTLEELASLPAKQLTESISNAISTQRKSLERSIRGCREEKLPYNIPLFAHELIQAVRGIRNSAESEKTA